MLRFCLPIALCLAACGTEMPPVGAGDASVTVDASPVDSGVRALCPMLAMPECSKSEDCKMPKPATPAMCPSCKPFYNEELCAFGACQVLENKTALAVAYVNIDQVRNAIRSFLLTIVAGETAGGLVLSCDDIKNGVVSIDDPCVTVVDSRTFTLAEANPSGSIYGPYSSMYPTSARNLFVVRGYSEVLGQGNAVGFACGEAAAGIMPVAPAMKVELDLGMLVR